MHSTCFTGQLSSVHIRHVTNLTWVLRIQRVLSSLITGDSSLRVRFFISNGWGILTDIVFKQLCFLTNDLEVQSGRMNTESEAVKQTANVACYGFCPGGWERFFQTYTSIFQWSVFQCYCCHITVIKLSGHSEQLNEQQKLRFSHPSSG